VSLVDVEQRLASLEASLRRVRARPGARQAGYPRPRPAKGRACDECHARKAADAFDGPSPTCRQCEAELATPARRAATG
jgi:hypothetical protein